ncbi:CotS family spore coat protein [Paenibacillus nasutitermitis]|uniref:CotS family spore coat protein n=1 Tax=Paenibacillus nasutitermitis TaxID=1652958 RepID=UPI001665C3D2|nr:CotS family spore coat protein [Paenibacillus nasutitermitis]
MENYLIGPWDHLENTLPPGTVLEQYVPPELEKIAYQVMEQYEMVVSDMLLITSKPDKGGAIWRINTDHGPRSLKVLHRDPKRSLFSIGAQQYMVEQGAKVPAFIPNKENTLYVEAGGKLWIVTEWIEPLQQVSKIDLEGAAALCYGLGEFHKHSQGYAPPFGAAKSSRLYGWSKYYEKIMAKIGWFEDIATAYREIPSSERLLSVIDEFKKQAYDIFDRFQSSPYFKMITKGEQHWGLAHQDYGWSNGQMGPGGIWVIDLDGVAYDLPFRDLRKLITSTMDDMGNWDLNWIRGMIGAYHEANQIDQDMFELLWIDMAFPNEFYKHIKEIVFDPKLFLQHELEPILARVLATESSKWEALTGLEQDKANYLPAQYTTEESNWEFVRKQPIHQGIKLPVGIDIPQNPWEDTEEQQHEGAIPVVDADLPEPQQDTAIPVGDADVPEPQQDAAAPVGDADLPEPQQDTAIPVGDADLPESQQDAAIPVGDADLPEPQQDAAAPVGDADLPKKQRDTAIPVIDAALPKKQREPKKQHVPVKSSKPTYVPDSKNKAKDVHSDHTGPVTHAPLISEPAGVPLIQHQAAVGVQEQAIHPGMEAASGLTEQPIANEQGGIVTQIPKPSRSKKKTKKVVVRKKRKIRKRLLKSRLVSNPKMVKWLKKPKVKKALQSPAATNKKIVLKKKQPNLLKSPAKPIIAPKKKQPNALKSPTKPIIAPKKKQPHPLKSPIKPTIAPKKKQPCLLKSPMKPTIALKKKQLCLLKSLIKPTIALKKKQLCLLKSPIRPTIAPRKKQPSPPLSQVFKSRMQKPARLREVVQKVDAFTVSLKTRVMHTKRVLPRQSHK